MESKKWSRFTDTFQFNSSERLINVDGDGNCLYAAVAVSLGFSRTEKQTQEAARMLRKAAYNWLLENQGKLADYTPNMEQEIVRTKNEGNWGTDF